MRKAAIKNAATQIVIAVTSAQNSILTPYLISMSNGSLPI
jgi:hypothetical protein